MKRYSNRNEARKNTKKQLQRRTSTKKQFKRRPRTKKKYIRYSNINRRKVGGSSSIQSRKSTSHGESLGVSHEWLDDIRSVLGSTAASLGFSKSSIAILHASGFASPALVGFFAVSGVGTLLILVVGVICVALLDAFEESLEETDGEWLLDCRKAALHLMKNKELLRNVAQHSLNGIKANNRKKREILEKKMEEREEAEENAAKEEAKAKKIKEIHEIADQKKKEDAIREHEAMEQQEREKSKKKEEDEKYKKELEALDKQNDFLSSKETEAGLLGLVEEMSNHEVFDDREKKLALEMDTLMEEMKKMKKDSQEFLDAEKKMNKLKIKAENYAKEDKAEEDKAEAVVDNVFSHTIDMVQEAFNSDDFDLDKFERIMNEKLVLARKLTQEESVTLSNIGEK